MGHWTDPDPNTRTEFPTFPDPDHPLEDSLVNADGAAKERTIERDKYQKSGDNQSEATPGTQGENSSALKKKAAPEQQKKKPFLGKILPSWQSTKSVSVIVPTDSVDRDKASSHQTVGRDADADTGSFASSGFVKDFPPED